MLKAERQNYIIQKINNDKKIISKDLSVELNVSEDTIRRDLKELEGEGKLRRVHSGALQVGPPVTSFEHRQQVDTSLKSTLATYALNFLRPDSVILIDGSTSNSALINKIPLDFKCTIITNSPDIAYKLINHQFIEVIMLGGQLYKQSMVTLGLDPIKTLESIRVDTYIMGIYNISAQDGVSVPTLLEAQVKQKMIEVSNEVVSMVTSEKLETVSNHIYGNLSDINYLIVDDITDKVKAEYNSHGVLVEVVK